MEDIYALLNLNKSTLQNFPPQAERIVDHQTQLTVKRSMRTLKNIEERMMTDRSVTVSQHSIDEIMAKVIENATIGNKDMGIWSIRELRIVSYYLIKLQGNEQAYLYALNLLDTNWRDLFFNGLAFYCLDSWNMIIPNLRKLTCELLVKKLQQYSNGNRKYITMKSHTDLFDEAGPPRLSALLRQKKQDVKEAPTYFGNRPSTFNQSYDSDVIVSFINHNRITNLDYVESILQFHTNDRTKKLVFADLVERINASDDDMQRTRLCKYANRILGDITLSSTWAPFIGATEEEAQKLKLAKQLVNFWLNQRIIETFFDICVQDRDRRNFWLNYVTSVDCFKIVGSMATRKILQSDSRVSGIFQSNFIETDSITSQTAALVLFIKNKMIVEFSDTGALYVYNQNHEKAKRMTGSRHPFISKTADLKIPTMGNLVHTNEWGHRTYYEEGRMTHQGAWQERMSGWMRQMILSSHNTALSFQKLQDESFFKAKPIPETQPSSKKISANMR